MEAGNVVRGPPQRGKKGLHGGARPVRVVDVPDVPYVRKARIALHSPLHDREVPFPVVQTVDGKEVPKPVRGGVTVHAVTPEAARSVGE